MMTRVVVAGLLLMSLVACSTSTGGEEDPRVDVIDALTGDASAGAATFGARCVGCHAAEGTGGSGPNLQPGAALIRGGDDEEKHEYIETILNGKGGMQSFSTLSDQDIANVVAHVTTLGS